MTIPLDGIPHREPGYQLEMLDGESLLFDPSQGRVVHCNQMTVVLWHLCNGERTVHQVITLLTEAYPESGPQAADDILDTLSQLQEAHAIRIS